MLCLTTSAQENEIHQRSEVYEWPTDPLVVKNLKAWQDPLPLGTLLSTWHGRIVGYLR